MNTPFSDYSKPAYFYRLFHEGRPWEGAMSTEISKMVRRWNQNIESGRWKMGLSNTSTKVFPSTDFLGDMPHVLPQTPAQSVDPLDGVW